MFQDLEERSEVQSDNSLRELIGTYWRPMLVMGGLVVELNVVNHTLLGYMPTYLEKQPGRDPKASLAVILIGDVAIMAVNPFAGALWDRVGRKSMWFASLFGLFVLALPMSWPTGEDFPLAIMAFAVLGLS